MSEIEFPRLYTQEEVADMMGVTVSAIRKWRQQKKISFIRVGNVIRFEPEAVSAFLALHRQPVPPVDLLTSA